MTSIQPLNVDDILAGIRAWIEIESPTDDPEGMARMAARVQADYEAIGVRVERIAGRDGFGDHLLAIDDQHCPREAAAAYSISREAVSCVCMSASIHCSPWNSPIGRPNCSRDLAQATACSSAPAAIPIATVPAPTRWLL